MGTNPALSALCHESDSQIFGQLVSVDCQPIVACLLECTNKPRKLLQSGNYLSGLVGLLLENTRRLRWLIF